MKKLKALFMVALFAIMFAAPCMAQISPQTPQAAPAADLSKLQSQLSAAQQALQTLQAGSEAARMAADNAWVLICSALVLMMTAPGLALFYGGLVRKKNVLSVFIQSFSMMAVISVLWVLFGYSLCFGHGCGFIGGLEHSLLRGVGLAPDATYAATIPAQSFMLFQLMFAIITPALITGAFAERMRFSAMLLFSSLWFVVVYAPMAHMVWGVGGWLNMNGGRLPVLDFAGGLVVHITSGVSALVACLYIGRRIGYPKEVFVPHSLTLSFIGAGMLWMGWFGFNGGSALGSGPLATSAIVSTHLSAAAAAISWIVCEWRSNGKPSVLGSISGAVAGLATITPASGFVSPLAGLIIGLVAGALCYFMVAKLKARLGYDDSLDVFGVHGAGSTIGAILTGVFASRAVNPSGLSGLLEGNAAQLWRQMAGVGLAWLLAIVGTLPLLWIVDKTVGLRVKASDEIDGLDLTQHNEEGYAYETPSR